MSKIKPLSSSTYVTTADSEVANALMDPANDSSQNDILIINKQPYQFSTLIFGSGNFADSKFDVLLIAYSEPHLNSGTINDISEARRVSIDCYLDRQGFDGEVVLSISDPDGVLDSDAIANFADDSSRQIAMTTNTLVPGSHEVTITATVGAVSKSRTFTLVVVS